MSKLKENFNNFLPLNRKERFYTGTILPQIICYENFKYFNLFTNLIEDFEHEIEIKPNATENNIQFLTEYSLKESFLKNTVSKEFIDIPGTKETPDLVVLITEPELILIVAEAKMYSSATAYDLANQMDAQRKIIESIKNTLNIRKHNIFHVGIVPSKMVNKEFFKKYQIIYWEDILSAYEHLLSGNYFFEILKLAVENYEQLSSKISRGTSGKNMDFRMTGMEIIEQYRKGENFLVGRKGGLRGQHLYNDKRSGKWRNFSYEVNFSNSNPPNVNWFWAKEFSEYINYNAQKTVNLSASRRKNVNSESKNDSIMQNPWHFSHLGAEFFYEITTALGFGRKLNVPIDIVYIGRTGKSYIERRNGYDVSPNWAVILKSGETYRQRKAFGHPIGSVEQGLWDESRCNIYSWDEIVEYFRSIHKTE